MEFLCKNTLDWMLWQIPSACVKLANNRRKQETAYSKILDWILESVAVDCHV